VMALSPAADHAKRSELHVHMRRLFDLNIPVASPCTYNAAWSWQWSVRVLAC
jgi:hypothetical protein